MCYSRKSASGGPGSLETLEKDSSSHFSMNYIVPKMAMPYSFTSMCKSGTACEVPRMTISQAFEYRTANSRRVFNEL